MSRLHASDIAFVLFIVFTFTDIATTLHAYEYEANPVAGALLKIHPFLFMLTKFVAALCIGIFWFAYPEDKRIAFGIYSVACVLATATGMNIGMFINQGLLG